MSSKAWGNISAVLASIVMFILSVDFLGIDTNTLFIAPELPANILTFLASSILPIRLSILGAVIAGRIISLSPL